MSKASLLELSHGEKKYKEILFPVPDGGNAEGISIEQFCSRNKVPYNIFYKWYKESAN